MADELENNGEGENPGEVADTERIRTQILTRLRSVIDPETGVDVVRMRLIENLTVDEDGTVKYIFRPSSPICPIAVPLALEIKRVISEVEGVGDQVIVVAGYVQADALTAMLNRK